MKCFKLVVAAIAVISLGVACSAGPHKPVDPDILQQYWYQQQLQEALNPESSIYNLMTPSVPRPPMQRVPVPVPYPVPYDAYGYDPLLVPY